MEIFGIPAEAEKGQEYLSRVPLHHWLVELKWVPVWLYDNIS